MDTSWKAGAGSTVITPAESMWLAGWAVRTEPARGTASDLFAKALAIEDPLGRRLVLLTVDLIAVSRELAEAVAGQVQHRFGLARKDLILGASHTHCGPEIRPDKVPFFHIPPESAARIAGYVAGLTTRMVAVVGTALADLRPARLTVHRTSAPFAHNRRGAEAVDHDVPVLAVSDLSRSGRLRAVVFGYACHNLTMPPDDGRYCGDYTGFAQAAVEAAEPGSVALYLAGAGADQDPDPRGSLELARRHGRTLADAVLGCLSAPGAGRAIDGGLRVAYDEVPLEFQPLPPRSALIAEAASADLPTRIKAEHLLTRLDRGEPFAAAYPCPVHVARLGDALLLVALGGEPVIDYAHHLKARHAAPGRLVWVAGYANDMFGYVPTARVLREGGYEGSRSVLWSALPAPFAESTETRLMQAIDRLVHEAGAEPVDGPATAS